MDSQIYRDGRHFDRLYPPTGPVHPFWLDQARQVPGPVLELACGTGRLCVALAQAGYAVTGLDAAESMLVEARRTAGAAGVAVDWVRGDMTRFDLGRRFALVILAGNSLGHLLDRPAFEGCAGSVHRHLMVGGRFIIDVFVPDVHLLASDPDERRPFGRYDDPDGGGEIIITEQAVYEPDTQIRRIRTYHRFPGQPQEVASHLDLRMYFPQELDALLAYNGFVIERKLADGDGTPFGPRATQQLVICRAA